MDVCKVCGLPKELCVCEGIAREIQKIKVYTMKRRFGKIVTLIEGINERDVNLWELAKALKTKCACGGTAKGGRIELQGDQREKAKKVLMDSGFSEDMVDMR